MDNGDLNMSKFYVYFDLSDEWMQHLKSHPDFTVDRRMQHIQNMLDKVGDHDIKMISFEILMGGYYDQIAGFKTTASILSCAYAY